MTLREKVTETISVVNDAVAENVRLSSFGHDIFTDYEIAGLKYANIHDFAILPNPDSLLKGYISLEAKIESLKNELTEKGHFVVSIEKRGKCGDSGVVVGAGIWTAPTEKSKDEFIRDCVWGDTARVLNSDHSIPYSKLLENLKYEDILRFANSEIDESEFIAIVKKD